MDLIKREDAIKAVEDLPHAYNGWSDAYDKSYIIQTLEEVPSAEKQGEWIWNQYDGNPAIGNYHCSICRRLVPHDKYAFCPNCGQRQDTEVIEL